MPEKLPPLVVYGLTVGPLLPGEGKPFTPWELAKWFRIVDLPGGPVYDISPSTVRAYKLPRRPLLSLREVERRLRRRMVYEWLVANKGLKGVAEGREVFLVGREGEIDRLSRLQKRKRLRKQAEKWWKGLKRKPLTLPTLWGLPLEEDDSEGGVPPPDEGEYVTAGPHPPELASKAPAESQSLAQNPVRGVVAKVHLHSPYTPGSFPERVRPGALEVQGRVLHRPALQICPHLPPEPGQVGKMEEGMPGWVSPASQGHFPELGAVVEQSSPRRRNPGRKILEKACPLSLQFPEKRSHGG